MVGLPLMLGLTSRVEAAEDKSVPLSHPVDDETWCAEEEELLGCAERGLLSQQSSASDDISMQCLCFKWNGKDCTGRLFHKAVLHGEIEQITEVLHAARVEINGTFAYTDQVQGRTVEGTGTAIHLAVSRGRLDVVKLLLERGASINSLVKRDGQDHYNVVHTAMLSEAGVSNMEVLRFLIEEQQVPMMPSDDGFWPIHLAFRTGSLEHIRFLRQTMMHSNTKLLEQVEGAVEIEVRGKKVPSPLLLGIQIGRMSEQKLARAAAHTPVSLRTFIEHEPRCVPHFVNAIKEQAAISASLLAAHLSGGDLACVIRESPLAAVSLLSGVMAKPECLGHGWHSLPRRVSFAPHGWTEDLRYLWNPARELLVFYEKDCKWDYDVCTFRTPPWHAKLTTDRGKPIRDCDIKVCHVQDIISADFFSALTNADTEDYDVVLNHPVVSGCIEYTWWKGACRVDIQQVILSLWGLVILILESWLLHEYRHHGAAPRQLRPRGSSDGIQWSPDDAKVPEATLLEISIAADFIGAKGVVDFWHELLQFIGGVSIGRGSDYLNAGNAWDLFRAAILMTLFFDRTSQILRVAVIFICWMRLLDVFTSAEKVAAALLPIKRSAKGLLPVLIVTLVSFCAFMHSFHFVWGETHDFQAVIFRSFSTLITADLPTQPDTLSPMELALTYGAVIFFSIFILNIFIGVIGQQYEQEKDRVQVTLKHERAQCCLNFLLRAKVLPCGLCRRYVAFIVTILAAFAGVVIQAIGLDTELGLGIFRIDRNQIPFPSVLARILFAMLQLTMIFAQYQDCDAPWASCLRGDQANTKRYLWLALPVDEDEEMELGRQGSRDKSTFRETW
mmetsp:Transcript_76515/g.214670  ORF Transcript_76515/g.214670 Transcript_76515/m.214670 type:complete len:841 (-) Transcript_76515:81-2603(-)